MKRGALFGISMRTWEGLSGLSAVIGVIALVGGGIFAVVEYLDRKASTRAAETLEMIDIWETRGAQSAFLEIATALESELAKAGEIPPERLQVAKENIARRVLKDVGAARYQVVVQYFTRLSLCIQARLCSAEVAATFYSQTLADFRSWFGSEIERRRKTTATHAREMDWLLCHFTASDPTLNETIESRLCD